MKYLFHRLILSLLAVGYSQISLASDSTHTWEIGLSFEQHEYATTRYLAGVTGMARIPGALGVFFGSMSFLEFERSNSDSESLKTVAAKEFGLQYRFKGSAIGAQSFHPWSKVQIGRTTYKDNAKRPFRGNNFVGLDLGLSFGSKPVDIHMGLGYRIAFIPKTDAVSYLGDKPMEQSMVYPSLGFNFIF